MTSFNLDELKQLYVDMTPGPWTAEPRASDNDGNKDDYTLGWDLYGPPEPGIRGMFAKAADAKLIAMLPEILEDYLRLRQQEML